MLIILAIPSFAFVDSVHDAVHTTGEVISQLLIVMSFFFEMGSIMFGGGNTGTYLMYYTNKTLYIHFNII